MKFGYSSSSASYAADQFVVALRQHAFDLDFSCERLGETIDHLLDLPIFRHGRGKSTAEQAFHETGLGAYIGEALRRRYTGTWQGDFYADQPALNFYTSYILFRQYRYFPSQFLSYRLTNCESEGTFAKYLTQVISKIQEEKDKTSNDAA